MATGRRLTETVHTPSKDGAKLRVEGGVIYDVRALGPLSRNTYGVEGVEGTEYSSRSHADAVLLMENRPVCIDHLPKVPGRKQPPRSVNDPFGVIRNLRTVTEAEGPVTRGDLHYLESHPMAGRVVEDIRRGLGVFGLSHTAYSSGEHVDRAKKRLVIESLAAVDTVDLVFRPATNRNLWESEEDKPVKTTVRELLEGHLTRHPTHVNRAKWIRRLTEDDGYAVPLSAEMDAPDADPDAAIDDAFAAAIAAIVKAEGTSDEKLTKIEALLDAQAAIDGEEDSPAPDAPSPEEPKKEAVEPDAAARELAGLKASMKLCESEQYTPPVSVLTALSKLDSDADRKVLIGQMKSAKPAGTNGPSRTTPRSSPASGRSLTETEIPTDDDAKLAAFLRS